MKPYWAAAVLLVASCITPAEPAGQRPSAPTDSVASTPTDSVEVEPNPQPTPAPVVPVVDGFGWQSYGADLIKVQFKIHNARECAMQSASILYGPDTASLKAVAAEVYANGNIVATITDVTSADNLHYIVACEVVTPVMVYRTDFFSLSF